MKEWNVLTMPSTPADLAGVEWNDVAGWYGQLAEVSLDRATLDAWLDDWVHGLPDRAAYLERLGPEVAARIRPTGSAPSGSVDYGEYR